MPVIKLSSRWANAEEHRKPFYYLIGHGPITEEAAETYDGEDQLTLIRRLDMGDLLSLGIAEQLDFMSKELMTTDKPSEDAKESLGNAIMKSENFNEMNRMVNLVVCAGMIEPRMYPPPEITETKDGKTTTTLNPNAKQKGLFYSDSVGFGERMELFVQIFDTEGLSTFRDEQEAGVGDVEHVESVQLPADGPVAELRPDDAKGVLL